MHNVFRLTYENRDNPKAGPQVWPETMWPLEPSILHGLPDQLWPDPEELGELEYPWQLLSLLHRIRKERITETRGKADVNFENPNLVYIEGPVWFAPGVTVLGPSKIYGPAYVGGNIGSYNFMRESLLAWKSLVGAFCEVKSSVLGAKATTSHKNVVLDSIIGNAVNLAGGAHTANVREGKGIIRSTVGGRKIDTGLRSFGTIIGEGTQFDSNSATMPGKLVGRYCIVGPSVNVYSNLPDGTRIENPRIQPVISPVDLPKHGADAFDPRDPGRGLVQ